MKQLWIRLTSDTPKFFKRIQVLGGSLAGLGVTLSGIDKVPATFTHVAEHLIWIGGVVVAVAQFACTNAPEASK